MREHREYLHGLKGSNEVDFNDLKSRARLLRFVKNRQVVFMGHLANSGFIVDKS